MFWGVVHGRLIDSCDECLCCQVGYKSSKVNNCMHVVAHVLAYKWTGHGVILIHVSQNSSICIVFNDVFCRIPGCALRNVCVLFINTLTEFVGKYLCVYCKVTLYELQIGGCKKFNVLKRSAKSVCYNICGTLTVCSYVAYHKDFYTVINGRKITVK